MSARVIGCLSQNRHHAGDLHGAGSVQSLVCGDGIAVVVLGGLYCSDLIGGLADGVVCECLSLSIPLGDSIAVGDHAVVGAELALGTLEGAVNYLAFLVGIDDGPTTVAPKSVYILTAAGSVSVAGVDSAAVVMAARPSFSSPEALKV